jgi:hypothetical protein
MITLWPIRDTAWRTGKDHALAKPHCDRVYLKNGSSADDVYDGYDVYDVYDGYDPTPMVKGGYSADNAALIVDKAEAFIQKQVAAKQNFLATI